ncbi:MAG: PorP/SprF family type IX secretion system membrane protein [Saprospiraceae bacterium]
MYINRYVSIVFCFLTAFASANAQQTPFLSQYVWNPRLFNPASQGGATGEGQIAVAYRMQFLELETSARPNTYLLHADFSGFLPEKISLAVQVLGDKTHILNHISVSGFFGYHLVRQPRLRFSLGATASVRFQGFDFTNRRIADAVDLAAYSSETSNTRFDGGPGLAFEYRTKDGSVLAIDAAASQLFTSDIPASIANNTEATVYTTVPHLLANLRFRYQFSRFALEPAATFRAMSGERKRTTGLFDLNLNAHFLENDLLSAGVGYRTDQGGPHIQIGVRPTTSLQIMAAAELHAQLGASYEIGATYALARTVRRPKPAKAPPPTAPPIAAEKPKNLLENDLAEVQRLAESIETTLNTVRERQEAAATAVSSGAAARSDSQRNAAADSCATFLSETDVAIRQIQNSVNQINVKRLQAEQAVRTVTSAGGQVSDETRTALRTISERTAELVTELAELETTQKNLQERNAGLRPKRSEIACIRSGDVNCVREMFAASLSQVGGLPNNLSPLRCFVFPGAATVTYHYPDDNEGFALTTDRTSLATHIADRIGQLEEQGARLENITLVTELQEDKSTLSYQLPLRYDGSLGSEPIHYTLVDNDSAASSAQSVSLNNGNRVSLEALGVLKLEALRAFLIRQGVPQGRILLQIRYNHGTNIYREETKVVVKFRG